MAIFWRNISQAGLEPKFLEDVQHLLHCSPYDWYVTEAFRSFERSAFLYDEYKNGRILKDEHGQPVRDVAGDYVRIRDASGKIVKGVRAAPAGRSAHNYGMAIDVALDGSPKPGLQMLWDVNSKGWQWLKATTVPHPRLKNGWSFGDWPHIERYNWKKLI